MKYFFCSIAFLFFFTLSGQENLALGKNVRETSTYPGSAPGSAVDGNTDGNYTNGSVSHTNEGTGEFWQVDLGKVYDIERIKLYNRTDCCPERLNNFTILVTEDGNWNTATAFAQGEPYSTNPIREFSGNSRGRWVRIILNGKGYLSLAEVEVFGPDTPAARSTLLTETKTVSGSFIVNLTTSNQKSAGTDDEIQIRMIGYQGQATPWMICNYSGYDDFERGETATYTLNANNLKIKIGDYPKIEVKLLGDDGLLLSKISVVYDGEYTLVARNPAVWLDGDDDKYKNLESFSLVKSGNSINYVYPLVVNTANAKSAGTDSEVMVRISGAGKVTQYFELNSPYIDDLEKGTTTTYNLVSSVNVNNPDKIYFKINGDDGWKLASANFHLNGYRFSTKLVNEFLDDDASKSYSLERLSLDNQIQIQLEKIICVNEDDGGGSAEELYGTIYVEINGYRQELWSRSEKNNMELTEGQAYALNRTVFDYVNNTDKVTIGGSLKEYDDGTFLNPNDNLGSESKKLTVAQLLAQNKQVIRFTHDDTIIDVHFKISRPRGKYLRLKTIKCIVPSKGTDGATAALVGVGIGVTSLGLALGAGVAGFPHTSAFILEQGMTAAFASNAWVDLYGTNHPGEDDLYLRLGGNRIWPYGRWTGIESQETKTVEQIYPFNEDLTFEIMEYDSASDNDSMGKFTLSPKDKTANETFTLLVEEEDEGSIYELIFEIINY